VHDFVGQDERLLKYVRPMMSWPHPESVFKHRAEYYMRGCSYEIRLYDLKDVFSRRNLSYLKQKTPKTA